MKRVVLFLSAAVFTTLIACKNDTPTDTVTNTSNVEANDAPEDIAMADASEINADALEEYLYVTAASGLSLREYGNLQSEKLARMPYGTKVRVITSEKNSTMNVGGIKGGMNEVEFNHKKGFAFNGYLSEYFPPERDISAKAYTTDLAALFPEVKFSTTTGGTVSAPINTETISLPNAQWHEAYFMAQRLFDFPKEFNFPNPKGKPSEVIFDGKPKKGMWISQLNITRKDNSLEKIEYVYKTDGFASTVSIIKDGDAMKISKTETIK